MEYRELIDVGFHGVDIDGRAGGVAIEFGGYRRHFEQRRIGFHGDAVPGGGHGARQIHGQLNIGARLGGVRARHCDTGYRLLDRRNGRTRISNREQDSRYERGRAHDLPVMQVVVRRQRLRVVERGVLIEGVLQNEEILGGQHRHGIRDGELVHDDLAHVDLGQLNMEDAGEHFDGQGRGDGGGHEEYQLRGLREHGHGDARRIVTGARELEHSHQRSNGGEELLAGCLIARNLGKRILVEAIGVLVGRQHIEGDAVLVVVIRVNRRLHDSRNKAVQAVIIQKRILQFRQHYRNRIFVLAVLRVIRHIALGTVQAQKRLHVILVGVGLDPVECDFLCSGAVIQLCALEDDQRACPFEISRIGVGDSVHQNIHELIQVRVVSGLEERAPCRLQAVHCRVRNALLVVVARIQPDFLSEHGISECHSSYLLRY